MFVIKVFQGSSTSPRSWHPRTTVTVAQVFCHFIKDSKLEGINIAGRSILISQLADDTALFLKNPTQVHQAIKTIQLFSNASGLYLNIKKCEILD